MNTTHRGRIWRLRKLHQHVDAELHPPTGTGGDSEQTELQLFLNGELAYSRTWPTRAEALEAAARQRAELERDGWMFHW
jgi:hypothetical protein